MRKILLVSILSVCVLGGGVAADDGIGSDCDEDSDCSNIPNAVCNYDYECDCDSGHVAAADKTKCLPIASTAGDPCEVTEQCSGIPSSKCLNGACVVTQAAAETSTTTTVKPKEECKTDSECSTFLMKRACKNGTCVLEVPVPVAPRTLGPDAFILNRPCGNSSECSVEGSACVDKVCKCKEGFVPSLNLKSCLQQAKSVGEKCVEDAQCLLLNGSVCETGKCSEKITRLSTNVSEKMPVLSIGSSCQSDSECKHLGHAECRENVCQCTEGFVTSVSSNSCLEKAKKEGEPCLIDKQCEDIEEATCVQGKCVRPALVGTKLDKANGGSRGRTDSVALLTLSAIFLIKMFSL